MKNVEKRENGITLVALVVTTVVLLILAGITLMYVLGDNSVFKQAQEAKEKINIAKAREKLEVVLSEAKIHKHTESKYNQEDYLDQMILDRIKDAKIQGDIAISDGYAFLLDRNTPWIGEYIGEEKELIFPVVTVAEVTQANSEDNYRTAIISITATMSQEATNGISRIEIWLNGVKLSTISCNNEKTVTKEYIANKNGMYIIKAYADILGGNGKTKVEGIVPTVEFSPNGSTEWKKSHTTTVKINETEEKVTGMKYLWRKSDEGQPKIEEFAEGCTNSSTIIGQGENMTGKYYLWILVEMEIESNERTYISGSEEFYFDNEGPTINFSANKYSIDGISLVGMVSDKCTSITSVEFFVDDNREPHSKKEYEENSREVSITMNLMNLTSGQHDITIVAYDSLGLYSVQKLKAETKRHYWNVYTCSDTIKYRIRTTSEERDKSLTGTVYGLGFNSNTGFYLNGSSWNMSDDSSKQSVYF